MHTATTFPHFWLTFVLQLVSQTLKSPQTSARILLACKAYEDVDGCPFIGMDAPELADALLRFFGMFTAASGKKGLFRLIPWFVHTYKDLAKAGVRALYVALVLYNHLRSLIEQETPRFASPSQRSRPNSPTSGGLRRKLRRARRVSVLRQLIYLC